MHDSFDRRAFLSNVRRFRPEHDTPSRIAAMYSAAIAVADKQCQNMVVRTGQESGVDRRALYEVVLQSYLFLGFPRTLQAADVLLSAWPRAASGEPIASQLRPVSDEEGRRWFDRGMDLYGRVYGSNGNLLKERVERMAPEIFRWMVIEGYGKVLSRGGLPAVDRELAVVACLMVENHAPQLHSHMRGALNVGCSGQLLSTVVDDLGAAVGPGYAVARGIMERLQTAG